MLAGALPRQDAVVENEQQHVFIDPLWISNFVDVYNSAIQLIEDELSSIDARLTAGGL